MSKLKEEREKRNLKACDVAAAIGMDKYLYSKVENGYVLFTPTKMKLCCSFLGGGVLDFFEEKEIFVKPRNLAQERRNEFNRVNYYNFCVQLPKGCCNSLKQDKLAKLGYKNKKDWLIEQIKRFDEDIERFEKKEGWKVYGNI